MRYFVLEVPTDEDGPDASVVADLETDSENTALAMLRTVSLAHEQGKRYSRCIITKEIV